MPSRSFEPSDVMRVASRRPGGMGDGLPYPPDAFLGSSDENDAFFAVFLVHTDFHDLVVARLDILPDVVGLDRQLAMAPIDENSQLNAPGASEVDQSVQRGSHRASR